MRTRIRPIRRERRAARREHRVVRPVRVRREPAPLPAGSPCDPALQRARAAGGPIDLAIYTCSCGYLFRADVSATVSCPHCGGDQAW